MTPTSFEEKEVGLQVNVEATRHRSFFSKLRGRLLSWGVESRGTLPVPPEDRQDTHYMEIFFIFCSMNTTILSFSTGTIGPVVFGLGLRDSCLTILFFNIISSLPPAYIATWGPKLGMRQMIISRYSFGYYGVLLPCSLNIITLMGFSVLSCILGGQAIASVSDGSLSWSIGIVVIALISLLVSFCGYNVLVWYERLCWIPVVVAFSVALGVGGKKLSNPPAAEPATAATILAFGSALAGYIIALSSMSCDFTTYFHPQVSSWKIFVYSYLGIFFPTVALEFIGAAMAIAAPSIPDWNNAYTGGNVGGLLEEILRPVGGFGKFLTVLLSLSVAGNVVATFYSLSIDFQVLIPSLHVVPRYFYSVVITAILIPLAIIGSTRFYAALTDFLNLIVYWPSAYASILMVEHHVFRKNDPRNYDVEDWNLPRRLPSGAAAVAAMVLSLGMVVPCMDQAWFVGPIAKKTGDIGFEVAFVLSAVLYIPLRAIEGRIGRFQSL